MSQILDELDITNAHSFYDFIDRHNGFLFNFLSYFLQDKDDINKAFDTIINSTFKNHEKLQKKENQSLFLMRGCLKIALTNPDTQEKLNFIKESLYEIGPSYNLNESFFLENEYDLISYHQDMVKELNSLQYFLLQLLCVEKLNIQEISSLLKVSSPILEAYLFQLCMGLCHIDHTTIDGDYDIVETFASFISMPLHKIQLDLQSPYYSYEYKLKKVLQLCGINRYAPLSERHVLRVVKHFFPHFETSKQDSSNNTNSVIDQIRQKNQDSELEKYSQVQMSQEDVVQEYDIKHLTPQVNEKNLFYSKIAAGVLAFFVLYTGYQSLQSPEKIIDASTLATSSSTSLQQIKQSTVIGSLNFDGEESTPLNAGDIIKTTEQEAEVILTNNTSIIIHEFSKLIIGDIHNVFLYQGDIEVSTSKNSSLMIQTKHGSVTSNASKSRIAKLDSNYSLAANFTGQLNLDYNNKQSSVPENEQVVFGLKKDVHVQSYEPTSFSLASIRRNKSKRVNSFRIDRGSFNKISRADKQEKVILIKKYMNPPRKKHLEFLQKL